MMWIRRGLVALLSILLFVALLGTAYSVSTNIAFSHPAKIEAWLNQSNLYGHFVQDAIDQAKKTAGSTEDQGSVTLSDTAVQQAAQNAFSNQLIAKSVNTFIDSNYAWLQGKTATPTFVIDLTQAKTNFAQQVGQYVQAHITSLPVCTPQQEAELGNLNTVDPLNITCRPAQLNAQAEGALVTQRLESSTNFLSNPVITANNINPNGGSSKQPYYQKYDHAPKIYRFMVNLPWIYGVVALLSILGIIFLAPRKRRGLRRVGIIFAVAGIILVAVKFLSDIALNHAEKHIFNSANIGQLQQSLTHFLHLAESQWTKIDLWAGIAYILVALAIFIILKSKHSRLTPKPAAGPQAPIPEEPSTSPKTASADPKLPPKPTPTGPPPPPKRRRLVQ